jgi:tRNA threonylcarbamoyladenosine biosynthesis protein TsaE
MIKMISDSPAKTREIGKKLASMLMAGDIICLSGELGTGKTVMAKGISSGLGVKDSGVTSPTFVLMRCHHGRMPVYHFDLYRVWGPQEILGLGVEEFFFADGVSVIEWADRLGELEPRECLKIKLAHKGDGRRTLSFSARGSRYLKLIKALTLKGKKRKR